MWNGYGTFQRSLRSPFPADPEQVQAAFNNGILTVTIPKSKAQDRSRRIQIRGGAEADPERTMPLIQGRRPGLVANVVACPGHHVDAAMRGNGCLVSWNESSDSWTKAAALVR